METKALCLMRIKQGNGGETRRVTIPSKWLDIVGGKPADKVNGYSFEKGVLITKSDFLLDEGALRTIGDVLDVASESKPKPTTESKPEKP